MVFAYALFANIIISTSVQVCDVQKFAQIGLMFNIIVIIQLYLPLILFVALVHNFTPGRALFYAGQLLLDVL